MSFSKGVLKQAYRSTLYIGVSNPFKPTSQAGTSTASVSLTMKRKRPSVSARPLCLIRNGPN
jgi:hypothetical protein